MPTGQPQTSAVSAYDRPRSWVRTKGSASLGIQPRDQLGEQDDFFRAGEDLVVAGGHLDRCDHVPEAAADGLGAGAAGDGQQPGPGAGLATPAGQGGPGPQVDLLGQVVGGLAIDQVGAQPPDLGLAAPNERRQREAVATLGGPQQPREVVHTQPICELWELYCGSGALPSHEL